MTPGPFPVAEHPAGPVHVLRRFNRMGEAKQVGLRLQLAGARLPQERQLAGKSGIHAQLSPLIQQPADIRRHFTGKAALLLRRRQPAGEKQVFLRR